jgi:hypothetical protein
MAEHSGRSIRVDWVTFECPIGRAALFRRSTRKFRGELGAVAVRAALHQVAGQRVEGTRSSPESRLIAGGSSKKRPQSTYGASGGEARAVSERELHADSCLDRELTAVGQQVTRVLEGGICGDGLERRELVDDVLLIGDVQHIQAHLERPLIKPEVMTHEEGAN